MSLATYQQLINHGCEKLGVNLPPLTSRQLTVTHKIICQSELARAITQIEATHGWQCFSDHVEISPQLSKTEGLIEAEYSNGEQSLHIRLSDDSMYQVTRFDSLETTETSSNFVCKPQQLIVRSNLSALAKKAQYLIWYKNIDHQWVPFTQQFIGFSSNK